jgi:RimJ/RimL family protein N-acetyltransferase
MKLTADERGALLRDRGAIQVKLIKQISEMQFRWRNDPEILKFTRNARSISPHEHEGWLHRIQNDPTYDYFGVLGKEGTEMWGEVGTVGLHSIDYLNGSAEFSILIAPDERRKGYGRLALSELLKHAFKSLRLNCVYGETMALNGALKLFQEVGMKLDGTNRGRYFREGNYLNSFTVSILKQEAEEQAWWL